MITLLDPSGKVSAITETFSDSSGGFSTNIMGIPSDGVLGNWKITAHNRLDNNSIEINVSTPTGKSLTLEIEETQFNIGDTVIIKGTGQSDANRLEVKITNESDEVVISLHTPITSSGAFNLPWTVPTGFDTGTYTITISDDENSSSFEIFIQ
jgi:flagellar hook assembly protein FlgD